MIADADFQTELGAVQRRDQRRAAHAQRHRPLRARARRAHEPQQRRGEGPQRRRAHGDGRDPADASTDRHLNAESFSANPRYELLNEQIFAARGEDLDIRIAGVERLATFADTITPEAACTSVQLHLQVDPGAFGRHWNAAQAIAGVQLALGAQLAVLLRQGALARDPDPAVRAGHRHPLGGAARPRACARACGSASAGSRRSSTSSRRTSATSRRCCRSARTRTRSRCSRPATSRACRSCGCTTARSTAGTGPIYDVIRGRPHLRVENRVLPAGPTVVDIARQRRLLLRAGPHAGRAGPPDLVADVVLGRGGELPRRGRATGSTRSVYWPGVGEVPVTELVLRRLLPMAHDGPRPLGRRRRRPRPPARDHRAALPEAAPTAPPGRPRRSTGSTRTTSSTAPTRCAR